MRQLSQAMSTAFGGGAVNHYLFATHLFSSYISARIQPENVHLLVSSPT
jgi:hypothetical protein